MRGAKSTYWLPLLKWFAIFTVGHFKFILFKKKSKKKKKLSFSWISVFLPFSNIYSPSAETPVGHVTVLYKLNADFKSLGDDINL